MNMTVPTEKQNYREYQFYRTFWQNNLQKIEEISELIEQSLLTLEKKYADFQSVYDELISRIDLLSSIYSNFNTIYGLEYLLKLKALLKEYATRYTNEGINFNLVYYLHSKVIELRNSSFDEFPRLYHEQKESREYTAEEDVESAQFRWITFQRNGSRFITPYDTFSVIEFENIRTLYADDRRMSIKIDDRIIPVIDPLATSSTENERPNHFLIVQTESGDRCFAARIIGKRILARRDILSSLVKPFTESRAFKGHLRLFGVNHIYL